MIKIQFEKECVEQMFLSRGYERVISLSTSLVEELQEAMGTFIAQQLLAGRMVSIDTAMCHCMEELC